jgi:hypothetical protein
MASGQVFINDKDLDDLVRLVGNEIMGLTDHISDMESRNWLGKGTTTHPSYKSLLARTLNRVSASGSSTPSSLIEKGTSPRNGTARMAATMTSSPTRPTEC